MLDLWVKINSKFGLNSLQKFEKKTKRLWLQNNKNKSSFELKNIFLIASYTKNTHWADLMEQKQAT